MLQAKSPQTMAARCQARVEARIDYHRGGVPINECICLAHDTGQIVQSRTFVEHNQAFIELTWVDGSSMVYSAEESI